MRGPTVATLIAVIASCGLWCGAASTATAQVNTRGRALGAPGRTPPDETFRGSDPDPQTSTEWREWRADPAPSAPDARSGPRLVDYAPASGALGVPQHHVRLRADIDGVRVHSRSGSHYSATTSPQWVGMRVDLHERARYELVCALPCDRRFAPARYELAFSRGDGDPIAMNRVVQIFSDAELQVSWSDQSGARTAGGLITALGVILGAGLLGGGFYLAAENDPSEGILGTMITGGALVLLSCLVGIPLLNVGDSYSLGVIRR